MNDHNIYTTTPDSDELTQRLNRFKRDSNHGAFPLRSRDRNRQSRASSFSSDNSTHPTFSKTNTFSTIGSAESNGSSHGSRIGVSRAIPVLRTSREHAEVRAGEFPKGRIGRRGEESGSGSGKRKEKEFQHYGRHANQWLFNDFSVTGSIKKGWQKAFAGNEKNGAGQ